MPDLNFEIVGAEPLRYAADPQMIFKLKIDNTKPEQAIHTIVLQCQIQIEATRRRYSPDEQKRLRDLFDEPGRWSQTLRTMLWTHTNTVVPGFSDSIVADLPVHCTFDFNIAATKYFAALEDGEIPIVFQFSGTIFYAGISGMLQVGQISWTKETKYRLPVGVWKDMMEIYYPNNAWLCLRRDVFDLLYQYKVRNAIPTWEQTLERIIPPTEEALPDDGQIDLDGQVH
ncbi:MAG: DUF6084 family protein [Pyrinomonadaceae bacterium]